MRFSMQRVSLLCRGVLVLLHASRSASPRGLKPAARHRITDFAVASATAMMLAGCTASGPWRTAVHTKHRRQVVADPAFLEQYALTRRFSLGQPRSIKVVPDGSAVLFLRSTAQSFVQDLYEFDTTTGKERLLLTAEQILQGAQEQLPAEEKARRERMRMSTRGIVSYHLSKDGSRILVPLSGQLFVIDRSNGGVTELHGAEGYPIDPRFAPDGKRIACVRNGDLYITDVAAGVERRLTTGAGGNITNGLSEFVAQEEMGRYRGYWWSPDSTTIAYQQTDTTGLEIMSIMDAMHPERKPQSWPYPRPGHANAAVRLGLIPVGGGDTRWVSWDQELYPYLAAIRWEENAPLTILVQNREQTQEALLAVDTETGGTSTLLVEKDDAWINLDQKMPRWLRDGSAFLWTTERNGAWQLELRARDGKLITPLTTTDFRFKYFVSYHDRERMAYVSGGQDLTQTHLYRVALDGAPLKPHRMTTVPGNHSATFSKNHKVYVHTGSTVHGERFQIVRRCDGAEIGSLRSVAQERPFVPGIELTTVGRDPSFHAVLIRPRNFSPRRRYPVIVYVYGGPHAQMVSASPGRYLLQQWIADHGFIVVSLDGRGTPSRGRAWERIVKGDLMKVPLADQVAGLQALGKRYRELDLGRVGIYGWSFGGYFSAMAVMQRPDVYHVGVAGAPVCDWLDYDTHYTERYMGLPDHNEEGYKAASVLTYAKDLQQPLLIIHGSADDNVYFMHSLKMSNALFRAGKDHDFLVLSDFTHMVADPLVTMRLYEKIVEYFEKHLIDE